ncbi:rod shape-determining protein MreC [Marinicellulosiphila megalodicopiae]|uniref:rod shape-determining protein MreC n=1 Tax=Marinicellulosiphila megalodicopiae TaxID=2724896 RepID=UPI003BB1EC98
MLWVELNNRETLDPAHKALSLLTAPVHLVVSVPRKIYLWGTQSFEDQETLIAQNKDLENEIIVLERQVQTLAFLEAENARLRTLLNAVEAIKHPVKTVEIISEDSNPFNHHVMINRGSVHGVYVGQVVLDSKGVFGMVIQLDSLSARVMLVVDQQSAVPVELLRTHYRTVAQGVGDIEQMELMYIPKTQDVQVGDLIVTSGLGGRYPKGYPVATVTEIQSDDQKFFRIFIQPIAELETSRHLFLIEDELSND